jgi:hypothetical protein
MACAGMVNRYNPEPHWRIMEKKMYIYFTVCILMVFNHIKYEVRQCQVLGWKYFSDSSNIIDMLFAISFFITWAFELGFDTNMEEDPRAEWTRMMICLTLLMGFLKGLASMRAFTQFSFIV